MGLLNFLKNEFIDIIEWVQRDNETMVYRFPRYRNEIKYGAKLTVREGQTAIFVNEGKIADVFLPGIYELKTANLPILSTLKSWDHGFESPFKAEVYFFNITDFLDLKWGTKQPIILSDNQYGMVRLRAFGSFTLRIKNAETLFKKLVGTDGNFEIDEVSHQLTNSIATYFPEVLAQSNISVLDLASKYSEIAEKIKQRVSSEFSEYGLEAGKLYIENISLPENVQKTVDEKTGMNIIGDDLNEYTQYQAAKGLDNGGSGNDMASAGIGMAMGMQMGNNLTKSMQKTTENTNQTVQNVPPELPKIYYLMILGERLGPISLQEIYKKLQSGQANERTLLWKKGMSSWEPIAEISEIDLSQLPPPLNA